MAMTFDATLKDMGRESPQGFLATFDRPPTLPVRLLNVDLSTVTTAADLVLGLGDPLEEIIHFDFQSSAAAWKHADVTGLRVRRDAAARIFGGVRVMQESDTYLAILDEGQEKALREAIFLFNEERLGTPEESVKMQLSHVTDLDRLKRMIRHAAKAASWQEILDTP
jgi:hypothetical protein